MLDEIRTIRDRLVQYDWAAVALLGRPSTPRCVDRPSHADWFNNSHDRFPLPPRDDRVYLEQAAWVRPDGQQILKITSDKIGDKVNVAQRAYFRAVRDGNFYRIGGQGREFFLAPDRSITDGRFYTFLSIRSALSDFGTACGREKGMGGDYAAVATVRLLSVDRPPQPAGYGFAVLNREGRVLYHSDPRLSLRENFFSELSDGQEAKAMIYSGREHFLSSRYRDRPTQVYLHPLGLTRLLGETGRQHASGLYVAVFRDLTLERAVVARAFVTSLVGPMPLLVVIMVAGLWVMTWASQRFDGSRGQWLWPGCGMSTPSTSRRCSKRSTSWLQSTTS